MKINSNPLQSLAQAAGQLAQTVKDTAHNLGRLGKYIVSRQQEFGPSPMANQKARQDTNSATPSGANKFQNVGTAAPATTVNHAAIDPDVAQDLDAIQDAFDKL